MHVSTNTHIYICVCVCMYIWICVYIYTHIYKPVMWNEPLLAFLLAWTSCWINSSVVWWPGPRCNVRRCVSLWDLAVSRCRGICAWNFPVALRPIWRAHRRHCCRCVCQYFWATGWFQTSGLVASGLRSSCGGMSCRLYWSGSLLPTWVKWLWAVNHAMISDLPHLVAYISAL